MVAANKSLSAQIERRARIAPQRQNIIGKILERNEMIRVNRCQIFSLGCQYEQHIQGDE